jgi:hypothetical protein
MPYVHTPAWYHGWETTLQCRLDILTLPFTPWIDLAGYIVLRPGARLSNHTLNPGLLPNGTTIMSPFAAVPVPSDYEEEMEEEETAPFSPTSPSPDSVYVPTVP